MRGGKQHFTYSKMMAWVAFDRAIKAAGSCMLGSRGTVAEGAEEDSR